MIERNKNFYSLEELKRVRDCYEGYQDGEEVFYFVSALRYACDEIERLNSIIKEQDKELELERKSRQLLTDDLANVCKISLKKENIIKEVRKYIEYQLESLDFEDTKAKMLGAMVLFLLDKENKND